MTLESVRRMLRSAGVPMSILHGTGDKYCLPDLSIPRLVSALSACDSWRWRISGEDSRILNGTRPFEGYEDVVRWAEIEVRSRLLKAFGEPIAEVPGRWILLESVLRGALLDCLIGEYSAGRGLMSTLQTQLATLESEFSRDDSAILADLQAACESGDTRQMVLTLAPEVCGIDGCELIDRLGLSFPDRPISVTPEWVASHQKLDRPNQYWFYYALNGKGLFLVLFTRRCAFGKCAGCSLHRLGCEDFVTNPMIMKQVSSVLDDELTNSEKTSIREVFLSNNGSIFDRRAMPVAALLYSCSMLVHNLPKLNRIVFETRAEFVNPAILSLVRETLDACGRRIEIEIAIGVEIFDERLRNKAYHKGLSNSNLEKAVASIVEAGVHLRCYFMYRPLPEMTQEAATADIRLAADFLDQFVDSAGSSQITMHLNPTYVAVGTDLEKAFLEGKYHPVQLAEVETLLATLAGHGINIYVGLNDEGLAVPGGSYLTPGSEDVIGRLKRFNRTRDFSLLSV